MRPVVAIVGRPNVGKSTLFNRLIGFKKAVVHDRPGVTRDRIFEEAELLARHVMMVDTGGIEPEAETELLRAMRRQTLLAIEQADVIVFVTDAQAGYTPPDQEVASILRKSHKPVLLAVNKVDGPRQEELVADFWTLGFEPLTISAAHGRGVYELLEAIEAALPPEESAPVAAPPMAGADEIEEPEPALEQDDDDLDDVRGGDGAWSDGDWDDADEAIEDAAAASEDEEPVPATVPDDGPIRIAVVGRPNIGKSTLINRLLGEERHLVLDQPGTTTDPIDSALEAEGRSFVLVDTAGVRRKSQIHDDLEKFVSLRAIRSIERCHVTLLVVDATEGITDQDARLAQLVVERGRALIVLFNKWDLVKGLEGVDASTVEDDLTQRLPHASWARHLFISAKTGKGCARILPAAIDAFSAFNRRITTARLNRFLEQATTSYTPPQRYHHPVRLYYMAQIRVRPPTFAVFSNTPEGVGAAYQRYLVGRLREEFAIWGTPVKMLFRKRRKIGEPAE